MVWADGAGSASCDAALPPTELSMELMAKHVSCVPCFIVQSMCDPMPFCPDQHPAQVRPLGSDSFSSSLSLILSYRVAYHEPQDFSVSQFSSRDLHEPFSIPAKIANLPSNKQWEARGPRDLAWCLFLSAFHSFPVWNFELIMPSLFDAPFGITTSLGVDFGAFASAFVMLSAFWHELRCASSVYPRYSDWLTYPI